MRKPYDTGIQKKVNQTTKPLVWEKCCSLLWHSVFGMIQLYESLRIIIVDQGFVNTTYIFVSKFIFGLRSIFCLKANILYICHVVSFQTLSVGVFHYQVCSKADYRLEIAAHSYKNPESRCAGSSGKCCDDKNRHWCNGTSSNLPDPYFIFCLGPMGETGFHQLRCPLGKIVTRVKNDTVSFTFNNGSRALFGLPNPLSFIVIGSLSVRKQTVQYLATVHIYYVNNI